MTFLEKEENVQFGVQNDGELSGMTSQIPSISPTAQMPMSTVIMNFENSLLLNGLADFAQIFTVCSSDFPSFTDGKRILGVGSHLTA